MSISTILEPLNNLAKFSKNENSVAQINFYSGDIFTQTAKVCQELRPFSKALILYSPSGFLQLGERFGLALKSHGLKPLNIILDGQKDFAFDKTLIINSIPEDVRAIITIESELACICQELAYHQGSPCVIGINKLCFKQNYNQILPEQINFILSDNLSFDSAHNYSFAVNMIISLLDIKLKQFFKIIDKNCELERNFVEILDLALFGLGTGQRENTLKLLQYALSLELLEKRLNSFSQRFDIKTSLCIIKILEEFLTEDFLSAPDYLSRAKTVSQKYRLNYFQTLSELKNQINIIYNNKENYQDVKKGLAMLAKSYADQTDKIIQTFKMLGGQFTGRAKDILQEIKYSGDKSGINCLSLLRETGALG